MIAILLYFFQQTKNQNLTDFKKCVINTFSFIFMKFFKYMVTNYLYCLAFMFLEL